jgi:hypothetical protein
MGLPCAPTVMSRSSTPISDEELVALAEESKGGYDPTTGAVV